MTEANNPIWGIHRGFPPGEGIWHEKISLHTLKSLEDKMNKVVDETPYTYSQTLSQASNKGS